MTPGTIDDLRKVIALSDLPEEHLQWIFDRAVYQEFADGTQISKKGDSIDWLWLQFEGKCPFYLDVNGKLVYYFTFENDEQSGGAGGLLPYSRMKGSPGSMYAEGTVRAFQLDKKYFQELEQLNPALIQRLIGYMTERARLFATQKLQHEKVSALGQLAAGIAHELNNPASAINRISSELNQKVKQHFQLTEKLLDHDIASRSIHDISLLVDEKKSTAASRNKLSLSGRLALEDDLSDWFEKAGCTPNQLSAETFADAGFFIDDLENLKPLVADGAFCDLLSWMENLLSSQRLIHDLNDASCRISDLVGAIKSHVHMDRTNEKLPTDLHKDIENTLTLLGYKLRGKGIRVTKKFCDNLPAIPVYASELNQVWTNLIDNAIYAMPQQGELTIETTCQPKKVSICITDNGSGIPPEILSRIFDPFFTTKKVGEGTGIGLDLVQRIIRHHDGEIRVHSVPGKTVFSIVLPL